MQPPDDKSVRAHRSVVRAAILPTLLWFFAGALVAGGVAWVSFELVDQRRIDPLEGTTVLEYAPSEDGAVIEIMHGSTFLADFTTTRLIAEPGPWMVRQSRGNVTLPHRARLPDVGHEIWETVSVGVPRRVLTRATDQARIDRSTLQIHAGLIVNGACFAIGLWVISGGVARARRRWRATKGLCPQCGYSVAGAAGRCPECGAEAASASAGEASAADNNATH